MKKSICIVLVLAATVLLASCGVRLGGAQVSDNWWQNVPSPQQAQVQDQLTIPDVADVLEEDGRNVLSSMGLIPHVVYEYSEYTEAGKIIRCEPAVGSKVYQAAKVTIVVSKGPEKLRSQDSYANWTYITSGVKDEWNFYHPYIQDNVLYIECYQVTFGTAMQWRDRHDTGEAGGTACITDTFDKTVPVRVEYEKQSWAANETQSFTIKVPLEGLDVSKPNSMYFRLAITAGGKDQYLNFDISMTW